MSNSSIFNTSLLFSAVWTADPYPSWKNRFKFCTKQKDAEGKSYAKCNVHTNRNLCGCVQVRKIVRANISTKSEKKNVAACFRPSLMSRKQNRK